MQLKRYIAELLCIFEELKFEAEIEERYTPSQPLPLVKTTSELGAKPKRDLLKEAMEALNKPSQQRVAYEGYDCTPPLKKWYFKDVDCNVV